MQVHNQKKFRNEATKKFHFTTYISMEYLEQNKGSNVLQENDFNVKNPFTSLLVFIDQVY